MIRTMVNIFLVVLISFSFSSCEKDTSTICENLLEQGVADTVELSGQWKLKYFVKTLNGRNIKKKEENDGACIEFNSNSNNNIVLRVYSGNSLYYTYDLQNDNYMTL